MSEAPHVRISRYVPAAVLRISGEDALTFLQGQFTQDLKSLAVGVAAYGLWLNQKGKVLADSFVLRGEDGVFWAVSYFAAAAAIRERLEAYVIADDVIIEDQTDAWEGVVVLGENAEDWIADERSKLSVAHGELVWRGRRSEMASWEWLRPKGRELAAGGADEVSAEQLERWRIAAGIPAVPRDVGPSDLPNEAGLEDVAISYTKGCYLGQEVMARLKAMGQVRRRLVRVSGELSEAGEMAFGPLPAALFSGEKRIGEVRSAVKTDAGWSGLAMVSLLGLEAGTRLSFSASAPRTVAWEAPKP